MSYLEEPLAVGTRASDGDGRRSERLLGVGAMNRLLELDAALVLALGPGTGATRLGCTFTVDSTADLPIVSLQTTC